MTTAVRLTLALLAVWRARGATERPIIAIAAHPAASSLRTKVRTLSAYMLFMAAERDAVKQAHPEIKSSEVMSELGRRWKQLSPAARKPFEDKAAELKQERAV